ncbi:MAG: peptidoglycan-binding domain-containing protein [Ferrovibrio sp.]|uniref:peptidoglycan-binding domain-containing protein n=1 Tax=Ferrovibrio sp. TaxID=1917215 RepID=UPI003919589A
MTLLPREDTPSPFPPFAGDTNDPFTFSGSVGRFGANDRADVIRAQILLGNAGYYDLPMPGVPTGWPGAGLERAISAYQKDRGLTPDGLLLPVPPGGVDAEGHGETVAALQDDFSDRLDGYGMPRPEDVDRFYALRHSAEDTPPASNIVLASDAQQGREPVGMIRTGKPTGPQYAQAALPLPTPPVVTDASLPHERPDVKAAGAWLSKTLEDATDRVGSAISTTDQVLKAVGPLNLLTLPMQVIRRAANPEASATPPSEPPSGIDREAGRTPPLEPPKVDADLKGRPAEPQAQAGEGLTPPEVEDSIRLLPSQQRPLAEIVAGIILDLNIHGGRGKPETVESNRIAAKVCVETLGEFPRLGKIPHTHGGTHTEKGELQEQVIKRDKNSSDLRGSSRPDISFGDQTARTVAYLNTDTIRKTGSDSIETESQTPDQARRFANLQNNIEKGVAVWARKMKPGETEESYSSYVRLRCRQMWSALQDRLAKEGEL